MLSPVLPLLFLLTGLVGRSPGLPSIIVFGATKFLVSSLLVSSGLLLRLRLRFMIVFGIILALVTSCKGSVTVAEEVAGTTGSIELPVVPLGVVGTGTCDEETAGSIELPVVPSSVLGSNITISGTGFTLTRFLSSKLRLRSSPLGTE